MECYFNAPYDAELTWGLYLALSDGDKGVLDELMAQLCPLVRMNVRYVISSDGFTLRGIEADVLGYLFEFIQERMIADHHPKAFSRFLATVIRRYAIDDIVRINTQQFDYAYEALIPPVSVPDQWKVEANIYHDQLKNASRVGAKARVRFFADEKLVCNMVIDSLLGLTRHDVSFARRRFKLSLRRFSYLKKYCQILLTSETLRIIEGECEGRFVSPAWEAGGDVLRNASELG